MVTENIVIEDSGFGITYDPTKCNRCGLCLEVCPFNVWELPEVGPAVIARSEDCTNCTSCSKNCLGDAITVNNMGCGCIWNQAGRQNDNCGETDPVASEVEQSPPDNTSCCG
ncbi:MAG: 4Fe-4S dicluster domain-containing protein [Candidatus Thorarchaeota archaeon]